MHRIGIAWYRREQWQRLRQVSSDVDDLEETYEEWLNEASQTVRILKSIGASFEKVDVDVEELLRWCKDRGLSVDANARSGFAAEKVQKMKTKTGLSFPPRE